MTFDELFGEDVDDNQKFLELADCDCEDDDVLESFLEVFSSPKPRLSVEVEFDETVGNDCSGFYSDNVDTIYIEDDELRLVDGPIAQVIALDDIHFLKVSVR